MPRDKRDKREKRSSRKGRRRDDRDYRDYRDYLRPPREPEPLPEPPLLHVYATSTCTRPHYRHHHLHLRNEDSLLGGPLCGYAVVAPAFNIRVAEPLPRLPQSHGRADVSALLAALELVHGLRIREALIYVRSNKLVGAYEAQVEVPEEPPLIAANDPGLWDSIRVLRTNLADRGVVVTLLSYPISDPEAVEHLPIAEDAGEQMRAARKLARQATALHVRCPLCLQLHGRQFTSHECRPICRIPPCNGGVRFNSVAEYKAHLAEMHAVPCQRTGCDFIATTQANLDEHVKEVHGGYALDCQFCGKPVRNKRELIRHIRHRCHEAPRCPECDKRFETEEDLERHMRRTGMMHEPVAHNAYTPHNPHGFQHHLGDPFMAAGSANGGSAGGSVHSGVDGAGAGAGGIFGRRSMRRRRRRSSSVYSSSTSSTSSFSSDEGRDFPPTMGVRAAAAPSPALTGMIGGHRMAAFGGGGSVGGAATDEEEFDEDEFGKKDQLRRANSMHAAYGRAW